MMFIRIEGKKDDFMSGTTQRLEQSVGGNGSAIVQGPGKSISND
jgi:hypothetical protein